MTRVVNLRDTCDVCGVPYRKHADDDHFQRIDRKTKWGNPYMIGTDGTRQQVIEKYDAWIAATQSGLRSDISELRGKCLGCWCFPKPCHGDVLARMAEQENAA